MFLLSSGKQQKNPVTDSTPRKSPQCNTEVNATMDLQQTSTMTGQYERLITQKKKLTFGQQTSQAMLAMQHEPTKLEQKTAFPHC